MVEYCKVCQSVMFKDHTCTNPRCGSGNHPHWARTKKPLTPEQRHQQAIQTKVNKSIDMACRFLTQELLDDGYWKCECSACGGSWDWEDPKQVRYCPECGAKIHHE